jgi:hypothetical protein
MQVMFGSQLFPQNPQWEESESVSTQLPSQRISPPAQVQVPPEQY